jgi:hypothetical protein
VRVVHQLLPRSRSRKQDENENDRRTKFSDADLDDPASEDSYSNLEAEAPCYRIRGTRSRPTL